MENSERKRILAESCKRTDIFRSYNFTSERSKEKFYVSASANITNCVVPKAGSWFISKLFLHTIGVTERDDMHERCFSNFGQHWPLSNSANTALKFMVTRDPYSRLYSVYVDKYFLHHHEIEKRHYSPKAFVVDGEVCGYNITFQDFLDYSLDIAFETKNPINRHWSPLYLLCRPCEVEYHVIAKQETLSRDLRYIIEHMDITLDAKTKFHEKLSPHTICDDIHVNHFPNLCPSKMAYLYRAWESCKIRGFISSDAVFPFRRKFKDSPS